MGEEAGGAVVDARGAVHHLVRREAHGARGQWNLGPKLFLQKQTLNPELGFAFCVWRE